MQRAGHRGTEGRSATASGAGSARGAADGRLADLIIGWFGANRRDLPWRTAPRDPYATLVAELMLQQTQVSRVADRFVEFMARFPTARDLAAAGEGEVLALWSGLGYYRRAKLLRAAAGAIADRHGGEMPRSMADLRALPGVGPYTAGAVASLALGQREPIVDGNVMRVLMRVHGREGAPSDKDAIGWAWGRAGELVEAAGDVAALNEGLMELGATVCTPRGPECDRCPVKRLCAARRMGRQDDIPAPKAAAARRDLFCASVLVEDGRGRLLVEQRPDRGMWAGLWQAPTLERADAPPAAADMKEEIGVGPCERLASFEHQTTHRRVRFAVWRGELAHWGNRRSGGRGRPRRGEFRSREQIAHLGLSNPQRRILLGLWAAGGAGPG